MQVQADVGSLGIQGLGALTTLLATLSADNVEPMAVMQVETFGSRFPVSGRFAQQTPDLLTRTSSKPLGRLKIAIGWRKGDTASHLAQSPSGQAAALLMVALRNLFSKHECGEIISRYCAELLPGHVAVASYTQLGNVADMFASKLFALGFGNFLAEQVVWICQAYEGQSLKQPANLLNSLSVDTALQLLSYLSRALCEEASILRVRGTLGMGHVLGLVRFLFPHAVTVTVEGTVIYEGPRAKVFLEFCATTDGPAEVTIEEQIGGPSSFTFKIECQPPLRQKNEYRFVWRGWLEHELQFKFAFSGLSCSEQDKRAFANLVVSIASYSPVDKLGTSIWGPPCSRLCDLLEPDSWHHMVSVCEEVLRVKLVDQLNIYDAFTQFATSLQQRVDKHNLCSCTDDKCDFRWGWRMPTKDVLCKAQILWLTLGQLLAAGLSCFFVSADPNATVPRPVGFSYTASSVVMHALSQSDTSMPPHFALPKLSLLEIIRGYWKGSEDLLATSDGSTIYPEILETLKMPRGKIARIKLVDGEIVFQNRYYSEIFNSPAASRPTAKTSILGLGSPMIPSNIGEHSKLSVTVREVARGLMIKCTIRYDGVDVELSLPEILCACLMTSRTKSCPHPPKTPFSLPDSAVIASSLAAPCSADPNVIPIVMTQGNQTAQVLCCDPWTFPLLLVDCCLNCAVKQAMGQKNKMIVVA